MPAQRATPPLAGLLRFRLFRFRLFEGRIRGRRKAACVLRGMDRLVGVDDRTVIEDVEFADDDEMVVVHVRPRRPKHRRCGRCEQRAPGYDAVGRHRRRGLDLGTVRVVLKADAPRVACPDHG